ncbi:hypothetical protein [Dyadobacter sp. CY323]|uniref:hypothetical protein n=1 Tax=Dyadobacter sp. CY323 TaxID=2907302 RepID=UPI001F468388|nr:hypothetical protein [Dyadobacter sp. CY323]MCE6992886.1 hypothetical protein [Dyadobacter sp. CY323]
MNPATESNSEELTDPLASAQSEEIQNKLSQIAEKLETEENIEKLAQIMEEEWKTSQPDAGAPDLSFKKFEEKLKSSQNQ